MDCFLVALPAVGDDLTLLTLVALTKEPPACRALVKKLADNISCADESENALVRMLQRAPLAPGSVELKQLSRQGVGRFLGSASTCRISGVIDKVPEDDDNDGAPKSKRKRRRVACAS